jgi:monoterpene epsilon-lactone hydrolase
MSQDPNLILRILKIARARQQVMRLFLNPPRGTRSLEPQKVKRTLKPEAWMVGGFRLLTIPGKTPASKHVIYLPGGAYLLEAKHAHRQFAEKLVGKYGLAVTLIDYPKSPEHTYRITHDLVHKAYLELVDRFPDQEFCLMGDSAGGGLALAFLQTLRDQQNTPLPRKTVLISPWLDLSLSHPDLAAYDIREQILPLEGLKHAALLYSGDHNPKDPLLSPLYGDLNDLGEIKLIFGSEEVFYPDCLALIDKIEKSRGTQVEWEVGEGLIHAWPIFPFRESRVTLDKIARFLLSS